MAENKDKDKWIDRVRKKKRYVAMDLNNFSEQWSLQLSPLNIWSIIIALAILLIIGTYCIVAYTPVKEFIPGFPDGTERETAVNNSVKLELLQSEMDKSTKQYESIKAILAGDIPGDTTISSADSLKPTITRLNPVRSVEDSLLRAQMEEERRFALQETTSYLGNDNNSLSSVFFFTPLDGDISQSFDINDGHMGVDVVAQKNTGINATLDGVVIFASWTSDAGHVIQVQHSYNLVSVYKHNSVLLKKVGDKVDAGEPIGIIGNSGKYSTGHHLHFELWQNGKALNPQEFIVF